MVTLQNYTKMHCPKNVNKKWPSVNNNICSKLHKITSQTEISDLWNTFSNNIKITSSYIWFYCAKYLDITHITCIQGDSFGTRPKKMRISQRLFIRFWTCIYDYYTGCSRRNVPEFGRVFLMLKYTDITQNTYVQSWTVTEIMAKEKCGLLAGPRTVPVSWQVLSMFVLESGVGFSSH